MRAVALGMGWLTLACAATAQVTLTAVEKPDITDAGSRAFDLTLAGMTLDQAFDRADMIGMSANGDFRNQEPLFDFAPVFNAIDSFITEPRWEPTGQGPANVLMDAENSFTDRAIDGGWELHPGQEIPGFNGVIARIMLAYGGTGEIDITVRGNFTDGGTWSEQFHLVIPEPATLGPLLLGAWLTFAARRR